MDMELVIAVVVAVVGSNALWGFLQFLLERKDKKNDCSKKILEAIQKINNKIDQRTAVGCRIRILKFMDEIIEGWEHSKDSYNQIMQDITHYHQYCEEHPQFLNHQTDATIERLKKDYEQRLVELLLLRQSLQKVLSSMVRQLPRLLKLEKRKLELLS